MTTLSLLTAALAHAQAVDANAVLLHAQDANAVLAYAQAVDANAVLAAEAAHKKAEQTELDELSVTVRGFEESSQDFAEQSRKIVQYRHEKNQEMLKSVSDTTLGALESDQRRLRDDAIDKFEQFLHKYPGAPRYSPDAMFRLSELYFERSAETYGKERAAFETASLAWEPGSGAAEPSEPVLHYEPTIALMQRLITDFPGYRLVDGAYYLMGFCLNEQGEEGRAVEAFRELVARRPDSKFSPEVWTRIGEYYFTNNQLDRALQAYGKVLAYTDSSYYDKALYKLAWTHYRLADAERAPQEFQKSVDTFVKLLDFNEKSKVDGHERGGDLREESFQYIAISYAEEHWGSLERLANYFKSLGGRPYQRDVFLALGDTYFDQTRFPEAVRAYRSVLSLDPAHPQAPVAQDKLIAALERQRDFEHAAQEREMLTRSYDLDTAWYKKNKENSEAVTQANKLIGKALYTVALFHHRQAQVYKEARKLDLSRPEYGKAATSYGAYLQRYPSDKQAYDLTFSLAECLYYAEQYPMAADAYAAVRDSNTDNKLQEDAAFSVIVSYQNAIKKAEAAGTLKTMAVQAHPSRATNPNAIAAPLPDLRQRFIAASDLYADLLQTDKVPKILYQAAEVFYAYEQYPEARRRFQTILDKYPNDDVARFSSNLIIESYLTEHNYDAVESFTRALLDSGKVQRAEFRKDLVKFKTGAMFELAKGLGLKGDQEKAANLYLKMIDENPHSEFADLALNNAALLYEKVKRFDSASKLYERLVSQYPTSKWADNALFRVGLNAEHFFNFDKAIAAYLNLESKYPKSPSRADAIYNAALSLENTQAYDRSAQEYERYCKLFPQRDDAAQVCFRAGAVLEKTGQWNKVIATYQSFIRAYHKDTKNRDRVMEANLRLAKAYEKLKKPALANKIYGAMVGAFKRSPVTDAKSAPYAAEAQFQVVNRDFEHFRALKLTGNSKAQKIGLTKKATLLKKVEGDYAAILKFKQIDWTLASLYRIGQLYQNFYEALSDAPCPPDVKKAARKMGATPEEVCDEYRALLDEKATSIADKAVQAYETTVNKAREFQVVNPWTKQTLEALNKLRRVEWPLQKDAKTFVDAMAVATPAPLGESAQATPQAVPPEATTPAAERAANLSASPDAVGTVPEPPPTAAAPGPEPSAAAVPPADSGAPATSTPESSTGAVPAAPPATPPAPGVPR